MNRLVSLLLNLRMHPELMVCIVHLAFLFSKVSENQAVPSHHEYLSYITPFNHFCPSLSLLCSCDVN